MDIHATDSNYITGEEKQGPKTPNTESMKDQAAPHKIGQKIHCGSKISNSRVAGIESPQESTASEQEWKAGRREWMIIIVLAIVSLMVALDATILVPVLPVSAFDP